jgi:hypothetical protein
VRVIVVSPQPALSLALSTQLPDCDAHAVSGIDDVLELASAGSVVLLDVGPAEIDRWLSSLVTRGLDTGMVVVGHPLHRVKRPNIQYLPRPFSLEDLFSAFERVTNPPDDVLPEGDVKSDGGDPPMPPAPATDRDDQRDRDRPDGPDAQGARTTASAKTTWDRAAQRLRSFIGKPDDAPQLDTPAEPLDPEVEAEHRQEPEPEFRPAPEMGKSVPAEAEPPRRQPEPEHASGPVSEPRRTPEPEAEETGPGPEPEPERTAEREPEGARSEPAETDLGADREPEPETITTAEEGQSGAVLESTSPELAASVAEEPPVPASDEPGEPAEERVTSAGLSLPSGDAAAVAPPTRAGWFKRRRAAVHGADPQTRWATAQDDGPLNAASFASRIREGLVAARQLEGLLGDLAVLADVAQCGKALLEEVNVRMTVGGSAVALRDTGNDLQIVATAADAKGVNDGHLTTDHPFVRAVESHGGALLLSPTDEVRGLLAGVPLSQWPVLVAATIPGDGQLEGIVLLGQPLPADPTDVDRLYAIVSDAGDMLRLAAILRRLPRPNDEHLDYLHTWMRREAP